MVIANPENQVNNWNELCRFVQQEKFEPVEVIDGGESILFDYSSRREQAWMVGVAVSALVAIALAVVLSVPFAFLVTFFFIYLNRSTDDYLVLNGNKQVFSHVKKFLGKTSEEEILRFDQINSVIVRPVEQKTGGTKWTEYWIELEDEAGQISQLLTHPDSRNEQQALRIGAAVAGLVNVPLVATD